MNTITNNNLTSSTDTFRILAKGHYINNNTWSSGINNNDLIIGPSGAGKTRSYVKPNLLQCNESIVVADTKGNLRREIGPVMKKKGYKIIDIDFVDLKTSKYGYNPLDFIRYDENTGKYNEQDIMTAANALCPESAYDDPYWDNSAKQLITCALCYILDCLPEEEHNLNSLCKLVCEMSPNIDELGVRRPSNFDRLMEEYCTLYPDSCGTKKYKIFRNVCAAEKTYGCILGFVAEKLDVFSFDGATSFFGNPNKLDFKQLAQQKTVVFLNVSDTDRSMDRLVNVFYTQCFQSLCKIADSSKNSRLKVPVRIILDDFATNVRIPDFDKIISVIRSREIYTSIILQSISQLEAVYDRATAYTIINNCDTMLYLGGQDVETAQLIGTKVNKTANTILNLPLGEAYLFVRGSEPAKVRKFELKEHPLYKLLPESRINSAIENAINMI